MKKKTDLEIVMKGLGYEQHEIEDKIYQVKTLKGWTPITVQELSEMSQKELDKLLSFCWHDGHCRCDCIGITDLTITEDVKNKGYWDVSWSDGNGDPQIYVDSLSTVINNIGNGDWNYELFKKDKK